MDLRRPADGVDTEQVIMCAVRVNLGTLTIPVIAVKDLIADRRASGGFKTSQMARCWMRARRGG